jgi:hypothetical protein
MKATKNSCLRTVRPLLFRLRGARVDGGIVVCERGVRGQEDVPGTEGRIRTSVYDLEDDLSVRDGDGEVATAASADDGSGASEGLGESDGSSSGPQCCGHNDAECTDTGELAQAGVV